MFQLIRKDSGEGIVYAVSKRQILVASLADDAAQKKPCGDRAGCGHCGGCDALPDVYVDKFHIPVSNTGAFKVGDRVNYNRYIPEPNITGILVFGVPLALTITTMVLWLLNAPDRAESLPAVLTIAAAFFAGIAVLAVLNGLFRKKFPATITNSTERAL